MLVQVGLCRTCSETTWLGFPRGGSNVFQNVHPGMLVYGYVNVIETYSIKMSLPNGLMGTVPITDVSPVYTEMIQQFAAKSETEQDQEGEVRAVS